MSAAETRMRTLGGGVVGVCWSAGARSCHTEVLCPQWWGAPLHALNFELRLYAATFKLTFPSPLWTADARSGIGSPDPTPSFALDAAHVGKDCVTGKWINVTL